MKTLHSAANIAQLRDGEACGHRGCLSHISHPCDGCGRIAGRREPFSMNTTLYKRLPNVKFRTLAIIISDVRDPNYPDGAEFDLIETVYGALSTGVSKLIVKKLVDAAKNYQRSISR